MANFTPLGVSLVAQNFDRFIRQLNQTDKATQQTGKSMDTMGAKGSKAGGLIDRDLQRPMSQTAGVTTMLKGAILGFVASLSVRAVVQFGKEISELSAKLPREESRSRD